LDEMKLEKEQKERRNAKNKIRKDGDT